MSVMTCPKCGCNVLWLDLFCEGVFCDCGVTLKDFLNAAQDSFGVFSVYFFKQHGSVFYVGSTENLYRRMKQHVTHKDGRLHGRIQTLTFQALKTANLTIHLSYTFDEQTLHKILNYENDVQQSPGGGCSARCRFWNGMEWVKADRCDAVIPYALSLHMSEVLAWEEKCILHRRDFYYELATEKCYPYLRKVYEHKHTHPAVSQLRYTAELAKLKLEHTKRQCSLRISEALENMHKAITGSSEPLPLAQEQADIFELEKAELVKLFDV